jgi:hypothetical protein
MMPLQWKSDFFKNILFLVEISIWGRLKLLPFEWFLLGVGAKSAKYQEIY